MHAVRAVQVNVLPPVHAVCAAQVNVGALVSLREELRGDPALGGAKLTFLPFFMKVGGGWRRGRGRGKNKLCSFP